MTNRWMSPPPTKCDVCATPIVDKFYDARVPRFGMFGCICPSCFKKERGELGTGKGQEYTLKDGIWEKTGG